MSLNILRLKWTCPLFNVLIFINLMAVFYLLRDLKFSITLEINNYDEEDEEENENVN